MRRNFYKMASVMTAVTVSVSAVTTPMVSMAQIIEENTTTKTISTGDTINVNKTEAGVVTNNGGTVNSNEEKGVVFNNGGTVSNNSSGSDTEDGGVINKGPDKEHKGTVTDNTGYVYNGSNGVVENNNARGYVENKVGGTVNNNNGSNNPDIAGGIVKNEGGTVDNNSSGGGTTREGGVINIGIDKDNKGTVNNNEGYVYNGSNGVVENNNARGYVENKVGGTVNNNYGSDDPDIAGGIVRNEGGTVKNNSSGSASVTGGVINSGIENKTGTVTDNTGYILNNAYGVVKNNNTDGYVENNINGIVENNNAGGFVENDGGTVNYNAGEVTNNDGIVSSNKNGGVVTNNDKVLNNLTGGLVTNNAVGIVDNNAGTVTTNVGTVTFNSGEVTANSGTVTKNTGTVEANTGTVNTNSANAIVSNNSRIVLNNDGTIEINSGTVNTNAGDVKSNSGTVETNAASGMVENLAGGIVDTNNGTVYNMGGIVRNNIGTEFFSVEISGGSNSTQSGSAYGSDYNSKSWLGTEGTNQSSTTITVKPESGFAIREFNIPSKYEGFVTATKNDDGSWTLVVKSGLNIKLSIPDARSTTYDVDVSSNDDGDDSSSEPPIVSGKRTNAVNPVNQLIVSAVDYTGATLMTPVSSVVCAIDTLSAFNNFADNGVSTLGPENIMGTGFINLNHVFDTAVNPVVEVPVTANVKNGYTYKVMFSDGTSVDVVCSYDGILYIPVTKTAEGLTYIIYSTAMDPATAMMMAIAQGMTGQVITNAGFNTGAINPGTLAMAGLAS